jgi:hypothetical protein
MSTRAIIRFGYGKGEPDATIYRHCDGYPDGENGVPAGLARFFADVKAQTTDTRFADPAYLAAKYVVWQAGQNARDPAKPLDFLSVGVVNGSWADYAYAYDVNCGTLDADGSPSVTWNDDDE